MYFDFNKENNNEGPKYKIGDNVGIWNCKNIFAKECVRNWSEEVFVIKNVKSTVPWTYVMIDLKRGEIVGTFYGKELQIIN